MLNVTLMTCLVSGSPIKQEILELLKLSPFSCSLGSQEHRFVTRSALTDGFNYFLNITNKYSVAACFPSFRFFTYFGKQWCWVQWAKYFTFSHYSSSVTIEGLESGKALLVCKYMKGISNENPFFPKYSFTWNAGKVVSYLVNTWTENVQGLSARTATLLSILFRQLTREIITVLDILSITLEKKIILSSEQEMS